MFLRFWGGLGVPVSEGSGALAQDAPGEDPGVLPRLDNLHPIDEDVLHAGGELVRGGEGGLVGDGGRVEDDQVGVAPRLDLAPATQSEAGAGREVILRTASPQVRTPSWRT